MNTERKYYPQINIIKAIASFAVTAVHFRNRVERTIPEAEIGNKIQLFFSTNYAIFIFAVPLFLLATGFLSIHKKNTVKNLLNTLKIYFLYLFIAFISFSFLILIRDWNFYGWKDMIHRAMSFNLISGWYIELFVGLALIIPFINILIKDLSKKEFSLLIITLSLIVALPAFVNKNPDFSVIHLPNYWQSIYPLLYYLIGAYIRLYYEEIKIKKEQLFLIYLGSVLFIIQLLYRHASPYTWSAEGYYASIINLLLASSFFILLLKNFNTSNSLIDFISKHTLTTYIMSYPMDKIIYPIFLNTISSTKLLLILSPIIVIVAFISALISGYLLNILFNYLWELFANVFKSFTVAFQKSDLF